MMAQLIKLYFRNKTNTSDAATKRAYASLSSIAVGAFSDGENFVSIYETVRGSDVFVVQK